MGRPMVAGAMVAVITIGLETAGRSLFCGAATLVDGDTSKFPFADDVHPAPYTHQLLAEAFLAEVHRQGWR